MKKYTLYLPGSFASSSFSWWWQCRQKTSPQSRLYEASIMKIPTMVIGFATGQNLSFVIVALLLLSATMPFSAMRRLIRFYKGFFRYDVPTCWARRPTDRHGRGRQIGRYVGAPAEVMYRICLRPSTLPPKNEQYSLQTRSCWWKMISFCRQTAHELLYC